MRTPKNNLDPGQATMVVFPDTMYTFRDTQEGGGSKLITFHHLTFVTASSGDPEGGGGWWGGGGARGPDPLEKHKLYENL